MKKRHPGRRKRLVAIGLTLALAISEFSGIRATAAAECTEITFEGAASYDNSCYADASSFAVDPCDVSAHDYEQDDADQPAAVCEEEEAVSDFTPFEEWSDQFENGNTLNGPLPALTGDQRHDAAAIALKIYEQKYAEEPLGSNVNYFGPTTYWCVYFALWCAQYAGLDMGPYGSIGGTLTLVRAYQSMGRYYNATGYDWTYTDEITGITTNDGGWDSYTPDAGDFVVIENNGAKSDGPDHTALVYSVEDGVVTTIEGNYDNRVEMCHYTLSTGEFIKDGASRKSPRIVGYCSPAYTITPIPKGHIDVISGGYNKLRIRGWAYDPKESTASIKVHVYVGGETGSSAPAYEIVANDTDRTDVNSAEGISGAHGFDRTIEVGQTGNQPVYIYAINAPDPVSGINPCIWSGTVGIKGNQVPVGVTDSVTSSSGKIHVVGWAYDPDTKSKAIPIHVYVGGEASPEIPCKTLSATNIYRSDVNSNENITGNHGFSIDITTDQTGSVPVYVYAIDGDDPDAHTLIGNKTISVNSYVPVTGVRFSQNHYYINEIGKTLYPSASVVPSNANNRSLEWSSDDPSIVSVSSGGTLTGKKKGQTYITVRTKEGGFTDRCLVRVVPGEVVYGDCNGDGKISATDLSVMSQGISGVIQFSEADKVIFDLDGDEDVDNDDQSLLSKRIVGTISRFPVEDLIDKIAIHRLPDKTEYIYGDTISSSGLMLAVTYRDKTTDYISPTGLPTVTATTVGTQTVPVSYTEKGITRTTSYTVKVRDLMLTKLSVTRAPTKTSYIEGEQFDPTGMTVQATWNNGATRTITAYQIVPDRCLRASDAKISISYRDRGYYQETSTPIVVSTICDTYGHNWGGYIPSGDKKHIKTCQVCGKEETENCTFSPTSMDATCLQSGYTLYSCSHCRNYYTVTDSSRPALGHHYQAYYDWKNVGDTWECDVTLICGRCRTELEGRIDTGKADVVARTVKSATCDQPGEVQYTASYKGYSDTRTVETEKLAHVWHWVVDWEPTTTQTGQKHEECELCGTTRNNNTIIDKLEETATNINSAAVVIGTVPEQTYTGAPIEPLITIKDGTKTLRENIDYTLQYNNNTEVGTASVQIKGKEDYTGEKIVTFVIKAKNIADCRVEAPADQSYTGEAIEPVIPIYNGEILLEKEIDYTIVFANNTRPGTAVALISGKGNYTGSQTATFTITEQAHVHAYTGVVTKEPTCEETGEKTWICACGDSYQEELEALGHDYVELITKEATALEEGEKTLTCSRCNKTVTEKIPRLESVSIERIELPTETITLRKGEKLHLPYAVYPEEAVGFDPVWSSSAENVVKISETGELEAMDEGSAIIRVTQRNLPAVFAECTVEVTADSVEIPISDDQWKVSFYVGDMLLYEELVVDGDTVTNLPEDPAGVGSFAGWYNDVTGTQWDPTMPVTKMLRLEARFVGTEEEQESSSRGSGKDPGLIISEDLDVYMVKGQSYVFPAKDEAGHLITWKSSDSRIVKVSGKYKAKAQKETDETEDSEGNKREVYIYDGDTPETSATRYIVHVVSPFLTWRTSLTENSTVVKKALSAIPGERLWLELDGFSDLEDFYDITWQSSNAEVAKVEDGMVCALAKGTTKISAYVNGRVFVATVKVIDVKSISSVESNATVTLTPLQTIMLRFSDKFNVKKAVWSSAEGDMLTVLKKNGKLDFYQNTVVRITPAGKMTAVGVGTTTLTGTLADGTTKTFTVNVKRPTATIAYLNAGKTKNLTYYNVKVKKAVWSSTNESLTGNMLNGKIKAAAAQHGKATITCVYDPYHIDDIEGTGFTYTTTVYVEDVKLVTDDQLKEKKAGTSYELKMDLNDCYVIRATGAYQPVVFASAKPGIAFVDEAGVVSARGKGKTSLSARVNGKKITIAVQSVQ